MPAIVSRNRKLIGSFAEASLQAAYDAPMQCLLLFRANGGRGRPGGYNTIEGVGGSLRRLWATPLDPCLRASEFLSGFFPWSGLCTRSGLWFLEYIKATNNSEAPSGTGL